MRIRKVTRASLDQTYNLAVMLNEDKKPHNNKIDVYIAHIPVIQINVLYNDNIVVVVQCVLFISMNMST